MKKLIVITLLLWLFSINNAMAMRCHGEIVKTGDHKLDVLHRCGEPEYVDEYYGTIGTIFHFPHRTLDIEDYEQILIEEWIYNFGSNRLMRQLFFENGILKKIRTLGYGY